MSIWLCVFSWNCWFTGHWVNRLTTFQLIEIELTIGRIRFQMPRSMSFCMQTALTLIITHFHRVFLMNPFRWSVCFGFWLWPFYRFDNKFNRILPLHEKYCGFFFVGRLKLFSISAVWQRLGYKMSLFSRLVLDYWD